VTEEATAISEATATPTVVPSSTPEPTASPTPTNTPRPTAGPGLAELLGTPNALVASADLENAALAYQELVQLYPNDAEPWLGLASIAQREGFPDLAMEHLHSAVEADPLDFEALRQLAIFLEQQADYEGVLPIYTQMIALMPDDADLYVARAVVAARLADVQTAINDLQSAHEIDPFRQYAWLNTAAAAASAREYESAIEIASAGLEAFPESVSLHVERGLAQFALGEVEMALADFDAALAIDDQSYKAYLWRGRALDELGRYDEAAEALQEAGRLGVDAGVAGVNLGYEAMSDAADIIARSAPEDAFDYLAAEVIKHGSQDALLMGYARVDWRRGNTDLALGRLTGLVRDGYIPAFYWRGIINAEDGNTVDAIDDLRGFLAVRPYGPQAEAARAVLESLGVDPDSPIPTDG
jgi:tetratricopeptide (TPR) repeat protein